MAGFSSFGVPGDLSLKPEITAPGGNIYAAYGLNVDKNGNINGGHDRLTEALGRWASKAIYLRSYTARKCRCLSEASSTFIAAN